ncbi:MAG: tetratricopeptide repeat protein [Candidatus Omnitrophica bacterium]|nr:tetratricopeptide repeat protein [Candidatus Omnitrophota bacterium]
MDNTNASDFLLQNFRPIIIILILVLLFFFVYNQYILDRSLFNLKIYLKTISKAKDTSYAKKIKEILEETLIQEVTKDALEPLTIVKIAFSSDILETIKEQEQINDANYFVTTVIEDKEEKRHPILVALDTFFSKLFTKPKKEDPERTIRLIEKLKKQLKLYKKDTLQEKYLEIARLYMKIKAWQDAKIFCEETIKIFPDTQSALKAKIYLGFIFKFQRKYQEARKIFAEIKNLLTKDLAILAKYQEVDALYKEGKIDEAIPLFKQIFEEDPSSQISQIAQSRAGYIYLYDKKDYEKAFEEFTKLQSLSLDTTGYIYKYEGQTKMAKLFIEPSTIIKYKRLQKLISDNLVPAIAKQLRKIGFELLSEGYGLYRKENKEKANQKFNEALEKFNLALKFYPQDYYSISTKGLIFYFLGKEEEAIKTAKLATQLSSSAPIVLSNLGYIYSNLKMPKEAISEYKKALSILKKSSLINYNLGTLYLDQNDLIKAIEYFKKAINDNIHFPYSYNNLGYLLWLKGEYKEAQINFEKAISLKPDFTEAHYNLGVLFFTIDKFDEAKKEFLIVQKLIPNYKRTNFFLEQIEKKLKM